MAPPESQTPSDTPEAGAPTDQPVVPSGPGATAEGGEDSPGAPISDPESADEGSGDAEHGNGTPDEMYHTLAELVATHDKLRQEAKAHHARLQQTEDRLLQERDEARESGDHMKYALAVRQLNDLRKLFDVLEADANGDLRATSPQHEDSDGSADERSGDGDPGSAGGEQSVAGEARIGVGERGDSAPDGEVGGDDDPPGGSDGGGSLRPE